MTDYLLCDKLPFPNNIRNRITSQLDGFRLFYLTQDTMSRYITEERLFSCLPWFCHALCGLTISIAFGENFSTTNSHCWEKNPMSSTIYLLLQFTTLFVGLGMHTAVFIKQRQLEKKQSGVEWAVSHRIGGGVVIEKVTPQTSSNRKLWKHQRNVVSPMGSLLSFLAYNIYGPYVSISRQPILILSCHGIYFFCLNFIETIFSPTLRNSLIPWRTQKYIAVTV